MQYLNNEIQHFVTYIHTLVKKTDKYRLHMCLYKQYKFQVYFNPLWTDTFFTESKAFFLCTIQCPKI